MQLRSKFENDKNFFILLHSSRKTIVNQIYIPILINLTDFDSCTVNKDKLQN